MLKMLPSLAGSDCLIPVATAASALLLAILYYIIKNRNLPPGPYGLPILGYWPFLKNDAIHLQFQEMTDKYGKVFSIQIAGRLFINLGSIKAIKEIHATKSECFQRIQGFNLLEMTFAEGILFANGETWKVFRKFFVQSYKDHGLTSIKSATVEPVHDAINEIIEVLNVKNGEPVNILNMLSDKCMGIMRRLIFGESGMSDKQCQEIREAYTDFLEIMAAKNVLLFGPFAKYVLLPLTTNFQKAEKSQKRVSRVLNAIIKEHEATFDDGYSRNMVDAYIKERRKRQQKGDPTAKYFTDKALEGSLEQILGDGTVQVAVSIGLFIQAVLRYPEEQQKIYEELIDVLGADKQPTLEDKGNLPYINAFLYEAMRTTDILPFLPSYECIKETTLNGYRFPKGAISLMNIFSASHDPDVYDDPYKFNPSRYLSLPGKRREELPIIFGAGKRACIGEAFVMMQNFLFLATLIKNFRLELQTDARLPDVQDQYNFESWKMCAYPRAAQT